MSGFGLGLIDYEPDDDDEDIDRTNPEEWPGYDWTPTEGDTEDDAPPVNQDDNVLDPTPETAPGSNLITNASFEQVGTWVGWEHPFSWSYAFHGDNVARANVTGQNLIHSSEQRITVDPSSTYWASSWGWMERYTSGTARMLLREYDALGQLIGTTTVGEWDTPSSHYAVLRNLNPFSYWRLSQTSGTYFDEEDNVGGTAVGSHTRAVAGVLPQDTDGADETPAGVGNYIDLGLNFDFTGTTNFSISGWGKSDDWTAGGFRLMGKESTSGIDSGWYVGVDATKAEYVRWNDDDGFPQFSLEATPEDGFIPGDWYHLCVTFDGTEARLYLNGIEADVETGIPMPLLDNGITARIGVDWDGAIDELATFQYALTSDEVQRIYDSRLESWTSRSKRFRNRVLTQSDVAWHPLTAAISILWDTSGGATFDFRLDGAFFAQGEQPPTGSFLLGESHEQAHDHSLTADGSTLRPVVLNLPTATSPSQTAEGQVVWNSVTNELTVGSGSDTIIIASAAGDSFQHTQGAADTTWIVNHNLGRFPAVTVLDSAGTEIEADIDHNTINQVEITLAEAISGIATCS